MLPQTNIIHMTSIRPK